MRASQSVRRVIVFLGVWAVISAGAVAAATPPPAFDPDESVVAQFDELEAHLASLVDDTLSDGLTGSLLAELDAAERAYVRGRPCTADNIIRAYLNDTSSAAFDEAIGADLYHRGLLLRGTLLGSLPDGTCRGAVPPPACLETAPWAQLAVVDVVAAPDQVYENDGALVYVTVENLGGTSAEHVTVGFAEAGEMFDTATIDAIGPCESATVYGRWDGGGLGAYTIDAVVDPDGLIVEGTKLDNAGSVEIPVVFEWIRAWEKADLVATGLTVTPERVVAGEEMRFELTVENRGEDDIPDVSLLFLVDGEESLTATIPAVASNATATGSVTWTAAPGRHTVNAEAFMPSDRLDRNEGNNTQAAIIHVGGEAEPLPDLLVESLQVTPDNSIRLEMVIANIGWTPAFEVPVEITVDDHVVDELLIGELLPGEKLSVDEILDADAVAEHLVGVRIDPEGLIEKTEAESLWTARVTAVNPAQLCLGPQWSPLGPAQLTNGWTGRIDLLAVDPDDTSVMYVGSPSGGLWKSTTGGNNWTPLTDRMPSLDMSALVMDPTDSDILYAGSSAGIYKTINGGDDWSVFIGKDLGTSFRALLISDNGDGTFELYAAGNAGVWRYHGTNRLATTSTKADWTRIKTGSVRDFVQHPTNDTEFYVTTYVGDAGHVFHSKPSGIPTGDASWDEITSKLPVTPVKTVRIAVSPTKPQVMYAGVHLPGNTYVLYRSNNGGDGWTELLTNKTELTSAGGYWENWYNAYVMVDRSDEDIVYLGHIQAYRYDDSDDSLTRILGIHDDQHGFVFDPVTPTTIYTLGDGGIFKCTNRGSTCSSLNYTLNSVQFFDIGISATDPDLIVGGTQDNGTIRTDNGALQWELIRGGDGRYVVIDPVDEDVMYTQHQYLADIAKTVNGTDPQPLWKSTIGLPNHPGAKNVPAGSKYNGDPYMLLHPLERRMLLTAGPEIYAHQDALEDWAQCPTCQGFTTIGPDTIGGNVVRVAVDPDTGILFAGTSQGQLWVSYNVGTTWSKVWTHPLGRDFTGLNVDPHDSTKLWMTFSGAGAPLSAHRVYLMERITIGGDDIIYPITWWRATKASEGIPVDLKLGDGWRASQMLVVDPTYEDTVYVGTSKGVYRGFGWHDEAGAWQFTWQPMNCALPWVHVSDLELNPTTYTIYAATFGRGLWEASVAPIE
jgi:hypothetical protein